MLSPDYRNMLKKEAKAYSIIQKSFKKQSKFLKENAQDLYENHVYLISLEYNKLSNTNVNLYPDSKGRQDEVRWDTPLEWFWRAMWIAQLIEDLEIPISKAFEQWYKREYNKFRQLLNENWINYYANAKTDYAKDRWLLNLSDYKWAISFTTKWDVIRTLKEWIDQHLSRTDMQERINAIDPILFWLPRARTIAVTEMAKAYEYGNKQPIQALNDAWILMEKHRLTVWDERVRPEHEMAEQEWWLEFNEIFQSVWVDTPPWGVNCRCTIQYRRKR